ncbi:uncharacterized protein [Littorina saxatilis]|uniref:Uncharacterized protein n=1 Tax=Littorina saxatilis TaxID=31220 RepID=A0AAN9ATR6_9CAEN
MTSLEFFRPSDKGAYNPHEWGSGKPFENIDIAMPRNPTWRYTGDPIKQHYALTKLKLSNVRTNDELVPRPQEVDIRKDFINRSFPGEHPHTSHMSRFAVFPKFDSSEDPKRGVAARNEQPISSEMPANPYDVVVKEKTKGYPFRHEFQDFPPESEKKALFWPGEDFFDQQAKILGNRQQFYPMPPKTMCPNLQVREGDMVVAPRTANALRNVEREQWQTSQNLDYTGLGPSNPVILDNLEEKTNKLIMTGKEDDKLYQHFQSTFDPPRGIEGRLPRKVTPLPIHQKTLVRGTTANPDYKRKMTLTERVEHRLLYGADYLNLPDTSSDPSRDVRWRDLDTTTRAGLGLEKVEAAKALMDEVDTPYPQTGPPPPPAVSHRAKSKAERNQEVQQIETQNRWRVLEMHTPAHDQAALNHKMDMLHDKEKFVTFYNHESRHNEERAGLYKTSYDPHRLANSMNAKAGAPSELMNTLNSNLDSQFNQSLSAACLNEDVNATLKWSRTFNLVKPELSGDRRDGAEVMQTYNGLKSGQRSLLLPPGPHQARPLIQEKELLQKEATTMGQSYNSKKFLQENALDRHARSEPLTLMSNENQCLDRVRNRAVPRLEKKNVQFNTSVTVATMSPTSTPPMNLQTQPLSGEEELPYHATPLSDEVRVKVIPTPYTSTQALYSKENDGFADSVPSLRHSAPAMFDTSARTVHWAENDNNSNNSAMEGLHAPSRYEDRMRSFQRRPTSVHGHGTLDSEYTDQFQSHSSNYMPTNLKTSFASTSYQNQYPIPHFDLTYKTDARFNWQPGSGLPRPQTCLLKIQDAFNKSELRSKFHQVYPETNPELRFNIAQGKRHSFGGVNAQVIHG